MSSKKKLGAALAVLLILCSVSSRADFGPTSVVYPTGVYPDDVTNVQAALDRGGTVLLKAVNVAGTATFFNFGTGTAVGQSSGVFLNKDVRILGERAPSYRTTILGGFVTITCNQSVKSTIREIDFESPIWDAIAIGASTGSEITDNVIHNVVPVRVISGGAIFTFADAIIVSGYDSSGPAPQLITGEVLVARNTIDGSPAEASFGIQFDSFSADAQIVANHVSNLNGDTDNFGSGIAVIRAGSGVLIANNIIAPGPTQNVGTDGIFIGGNKTARYLVLGNKVQLEDPFADGIDVAGGNATGNSGTIQAKVIANSITLSGVYSFGTSLWDLVTNAAVTANSVEGAGAFALTISTYGFDTNVASLNRFIGNDLHDFVSNQADLFYDANTQNNQEIGFCRSVIDLGTGNSSTCGTGTASTGVLGGSGLAAADSISSPAPNQAIAIKREQPQLRQTFGRVRPEQVVR